jgi:hypothetical protein
MARKYEQLDQWETWVPDVMTTEGANEREIFKHNPEEALAMELRFLSLEKRKKYERIASASLRVGLVDDDKAEQYMRQLFADHVRSVKNYWMDGKPVTTGEQLFDAAETDLMLEVTRALLHRSALDRGLAKKLKRGSVSFSSEAKSSETGAAADVTPRSPQIIPVGSEKRIQNSGSPMQSSENSEAATAGT